MTHLEKEHQTFIDELTSLVEKAKGNLIDELTASFDMDEVLDNPEYGKEIMAKLRLILEDYVGEAAVAGQSFGDVKKELFKNANG